MNTSTSKTKKTIIEIIAIIAVASIIALVYNMQNPKGVSLIYKKQIIEEASSDELFANSSQILTAENNPAPPAKDSVAKIIDNVQPDKIAEETKIIEKTVKETSEKVEPPKKEKQEEVESNVARYKNVTYQNMLKIVNNPDFVIVDARREENYLEDHIPGAVNIFPYDNNDIVFEKSLQLPTDKKIVVYCEGGDCDSSHMLVEFLLDAIGLEKVYLYNGGWDDWQAHKASK